MYVFLADGFEEIEALAPVDVMRRAGLAVTTVSVTNNQIVIGAHGIPVVADAMFDELNYTDASLLFLPGGLPGATNLEAHAGLCQLLTAKATQEDVVSRHTSAPWHLQADPAGTRHRLRPDRTAPYHK